ncbi:hypothetical protein [Marinilabilia sp.]
MSLWNLSLEIHRGRFFQIFLGDFYILIVLLCRSGCPDFGIWLLADMAIVVPEREQTNEALSMLGTVIRGTSRLKVVCM